jgi:hypothetical protein
MQNFDRKCCRTDLSGNSVVSWVTLKWIVEKYDVKVWTGLDWCWIGSVTEFCEYGKESFVPVTEKS